MRAAGAPAAAIAAALIAACGGGDSGPPPSPVRVAVLSPADRTVVHDRRVDVEGTVRPSTATVTVAGRRADVAEGSFHATVELDPGTNVVDVMASAGRARPALMAIRIRREVTVQVPDLVGMSVDDATDIVRRLGLKPDVQDGGGFLDRILPGDPQVCATRPAADAEVDPGTTVEILAARQC